MMMVKLQKQNFSRLSQVLTLMQLPALTALFH